MRALASRRAVLGILVFLTLIFVWLSIRQEATNRDIRQGNYHMCLQRNINVERINDFNIGMIDIERHNPFIATSPATIQARIQLYTKAMLKPADCELLK